MNCAKKLYEMQLIDYEIQSARETLAQLDLKIGKAESVLMAKAELEAEKRHLGEIIQRRREMEWAVEDLQKNISALNSKLYGGKVTNPKELMGLEQDKESLKTRLRHQEDELLNLMNEEEETQKKVKVQAEQVERMEVAWQQEQEVLVQKRGDVESHLAELEKRRQALATTIDSQACSLYESIRTKKRQAVVKVEQGRCQGCRIALSVNEWQRAKSGAIVQCGSCGKILYLE